jgi:maltose alpha-D-glucosyltransferase/alpha-amylase
MSQIGRRTAELHLAFASASGLTDFTPEPVKPPDVERWTETVIQRAERVFDTLRQRSSLFSDSDRTMIDQLLAQRESLLDRLNGLMPPRVQGLNLRLHGDLQLEKLLIVKDDIFITGFEGDLRRPIDERRRKAPAARDVASLIWSIEASSQAARERVLHLALDEHGRLGAALTEWVDRATTAFLAAYREFMIESSIWPADPLAAQRMLDFFQLEKAFEVLEAELAQRPEGALATLARVLQMLSQPAREAA